MPLPSYTNKQLNIWLEAQVETTPEHRSRLNAFNWLTIENLASMSSRTDEEAIRKYQELLKRAEEECPLVDVPVNLNSKSYDTSAYKIQVITQPRSLDEVVLNLEEGYRLYLGNNGNLATLWSYLMGYKWACKDKGGLEDTEVERLDSFQEWIDQRYPFGKGVPWSKTITILSLDVSSRAIKSFVEHWNLFNAGRSPTTQDPTTKMMLENIVEHARRKRNEE